MDNNGIERSISRLKTNKGRKIYCRVPCMLKYSKEIIKNRYEDKTSQLMTILDYLDSTSSSELDQFGSSFPFTKYMNFILQNDNESENLLAFKILAQCTDSKDEDYEIYVNSGFLNYCLSKISNEEYSIYVFKILINGSIFKDVASLLLNMNICDILIQLPLTFQISNLLSNLTYFENYDYLPKFLNLCEIILNNLNNIHYAVDISISYIFKAIYHIYSWENIEISTTLEIESKFSPLLYPFIPTIFDSNNYYLINSILRYFSRIEKTPINFFNPILKIFSEIEFSETNKNTVKLCLDIFILNQEELKNNPQISDQILSLILFYFIENFLDRFDYKLKIRFFNVILIYYSSTEGVIDQFMKKVLDYSLMFINDESKSEDVLRQLISIKKNALNDPDIDEKIKSGINIYEELLLNNDENIAHLATELIGLCQEEKK